MRLDIVLCGALLLGACSSTPGGPDAGGPGAARDSVSSADEAWMLLEDMRGQRHDLSDTLAGGRSVALVFWQTWCAPCIREAPHAAAASKRLAGRVDFFGVISGPDDVVDESAVATMTKKLGLPYPQVRDRSAELARRFEVKGTPTIVVIEPSGEVSYNGHELPEAWSAP